MDVRLHLLSRRSQCSLRQPVCRLVSMSEGASSLITPYRWTQAAWAFFTACMKTSPGSSSIKLWTV